MRWEVVSGGSSLANTIAAPISATPMQAATTAAKIIRPRDGGQKPRRRVRGSKRSGGAKRVLRAG
ncbi:hypothetical protein GCM10009662_20180 [Catellatospora coxensis]